MSPQPIYPIGTCTLVGAGPGDPDLLTLKAVKAIQQASLLLVDDLVSDDIVALASPGTRVVHVGKRGGLQITQRLSDSFPEEDFVHRTGLRHLKELSTTELGPFVVLLEKKGKPNRYYLDLSKVANWMMTEENALNLMLAQDLLSGYFRDVEPMRQESLQQVAEGVLEQNPGSMLQNIQANVRVVSDGIGRLNAVIDPAILRVVFDAIGNKEALKLHYVPSRGEESIKEVNPLGLVAKDGTIYLLATRNMATKPKHYSLHRVRTAERIRRLES